MYTDEETFGLLRTYIKQKALLTASIASDGEQKDKDTGLVAGHAYSILDAKRFDKVSLIQLNPNPNPYPNPNLNPNPYPDPYPDPYPSPYPSPSPSPNPSH